MIERARRDFAHARVTYVQGTLDAIERGSGFDAITAMHSFPYVREPEAFVARLHALLRPGGRVFILNANAHTLWDRLCLWFVERTTTPAVYRPTWEIQRLLTGAGFRETAVTPLPKPFYMPSIHLVEGVA